MQLLYNYVEPLNKIAADNSKFPAAMPLILGWLSQLILWSCSHLHITMHWLPLMFVLTSKTGAPHSWNRLKSFVSSFSKTMYFKSFLGSAPFKSMQFSSSSVASEPDSGTQFGSFIYLIFI